MRTFNVTFVILALLSLDTRLAMAGATPPNKEEHPGEIATYLDRAGLYQTEFDGKVARCVRLAHRTEYGQLRFLVLPLLSWVPAERVEIV